MIYATPKFDLILGNNNFEYVCLHAVYDVGMKDDIEFNHGLAHLAEHIIEKQFVTEGNFCVETNAFLNKEYTCFYSKCLTENTDSILKTQSELIEKASGLISDSIVESEKKSIILENEIALKNVRLRNVLAVESLVFNNALKNATYIDHERFLAITKQDICEFINSKYSRKPCMIYSGCKSDIKTFKLSKKEEGCYTPKINVLGRCVVYNNLCCFYFSYLNGISEYFSIKVLMECLTYIWNCSHTNKIISNSIKLFDSKVLLFFEFNNIVERNFLAFLYSNTNDLGCCFELIKEKVLLDYLYKLHNLSAMNLFVYKAYRYFDNEIFCYNNLRNTILSIDQNSVEFFHKSVLCKIIENCQGELNEIFCG